MIQSDNHVHTDFSTDSTVPMESQLLQAKALGLSSLCFTDHMDYHFPSKRHTIEFVFSVEEYFSTIQKLRDKYPDFPLRVGVELGLKRDVLPQCLSLTNAFPFDFVIGSTHLVEDTDPYYQEYWDSHGEMGGIARYYEATLENVQMDFDFDVYGHLDYVIRYCPAIKAAREEGRICEDFYKRYYLKNRDTIAEIFRLLIAGGRGIELNTGGLKYGLGHPNPHEDILCLYRDLGGEYITVGSDAHKEEHLAFDFSRVPGILAGCGFSHYTEYHGRKPVQLPLASSH